jgi:hypothetical protein
VSLTVGVFGCSGEVVAVAGAGGAGNAPGAGGADSANGGANGAGGANGGGGAVADAGPDVETNCSGSSNYVACCNAVEWSWDAGCMAWGPPMPPAMTEMA